MKSEPVRVSRSLSSVTVWAVTGAVRWHHGLRRICSQIIGIVGTSTRFCVFRSMIFPSAGVERSILLLGMVISFLQPCMFVHYFST